MAFNGRFIVNIAHFVHQQGIDSHPIIEKTGQSLEQLSQGSSTVSNEIYHEVIAYAARSTNDPLIGVKFGQHQNLSALGLIAQIIQTSGTVAEALKYWCQFANLGCSVLPLSLDSGRD